MSNGASQAENEAAAAAAIAEAEAASDIDAGALNGNDELSGQLDERLREQLSLYTQSTRMNAGIIGVAIILISDQSFAHFCDPLSFAWHVPCAVRYLVSMSIGC